MQTTKLTVIEGRREEIEASLLAEFLRPGVGNLRKVRRLGRSLRRRGQLRSVTRS